MRHPVEELDEKRADVDRGLFGGHMLPGAVRVAVRWLGASGKAVALIVVRACVEALRAYGTAPPSVLPRGGLEFDCRLAFVCRHVAYAKDGAYGIEQATHTAGAWAIDAALEHAGSERALIGAQCCKERAGAGVVKKAVLLKQ